MAYIRQWRRDRNRFSNHATLEKISSSIDRISSTIACLLRILGDFSEADYAQQCIEQVADSFAGGKAERMAYIAIDETAFTTTG